MLTVSVPTQVVDIRTVVHLHVLVPMFLGQAPAFTTTILLAASRIHRDFRELLAAWELIDLQGHACDTFSINSHLTDKKRRRYRRENLLLPFEQQFFECLTAANPILCAFCHHIHLETRKSGRGSTMPSRLGRFSPAFDLFSRKYFTLRKLFVY